LFLKGFTQQVQDMRLIIIDIPHILKEVANMTKAEIVAKVAEETKISKAAAAKALAVTIATFTEAIRKGDKVALIGFGTFSVAERKARTGRNPQTG
jgi:DNA-binding protein HU-beta